MPNHVGKRICLVACDDFLSQNVEYAGKFRTNVPFNYMKKHYILVLISALIVFNGFDSSAQKMEGVVLVNTSSWKGFEKQEFMFEGRDAWFVSPKQAVPGNPWVWRAHFPTWHTEMDSILLAKGF